ncbi:cellulose binding domain-containing protein [Actinomadura alba]|uniref:Cellulose binding domain-containing protein n=1 Tax=Actinomadura alba TaxID=406431 RepID=A0ABR7LHM9_9ACTN|nr:cellulose binding domain-containing protein [Actinomadura alba]MBC6464345.1 cellulose binding domain-containing protein [Actinomadura alba]
MGRHTKLADDLDPEDADLTGDAITEPPQQGRRMGWVTKVPLLPAIAGIGAIGVVTAAWSTSQISLNFAGGTPAVADRPQAQAQDSANRRGADDRTSRAERSSAVTIAFRATSRSSTGFRATATIANHGTQPINGWTLRFQIPNAQVIGATNVVLVQPGRVATVRNPAHSPTIAPGRSVKVIFTAEGAASKPSTCRFNGVACTLD